MPDGSDEGEGSDDEDEDEVGVRRMQPQCDGVVIEVQQASCETWLRYCRACAGGRMQRPPSVHCIPGSA